MSEPPLAEEDQRGGCPGEGERELERGEGQLEPAEVCVEQERQQLLPFRQQVADCVATLRD